MRALSFCLLLIGCSTDGPGADKPADTGDTGDTGGEDTGTPAPVDADGDGFTEDEDCDDADPETYPGAAEACDDPDRNCDGLGVATFTDASGAETDWTAALSGAVTVDEPGTLRVCAGEWTVDLTIAADNVSIVGSSTTETVLLGSGDAAVVAAEGVEGLILSTLALEGGGGAACDGGRCGGGVFLADSSASLTDVRIADSEADLGGGVFLRASALTLTDSTIRTCEAKTGGGIHATDGSVLTWEESTVRENTATEFGGGLHLDGDSVLVADGGLIYGNLAASCAGLRAEASTVSLTVLTVKDNAADDDGGGLCLSSAEAVLVESDVSGNIAAAGTGGGAFMEAASVLAWTGGDALGNESDGGGAVALYDGSELTLAEVEVRSSLAAGEYSGGGLLVRDSTAWVRDALFDDNSAWGGGAMAVYDSDLYLEGVELRANVASSHGGGHYTSLGGGIYLSDSIAVIDDSTFEENDAHQGGGLYLVDSTATLTATTIQGHYLDSGGSSGGGIQLLRSSATLSASMIGDNLADDGGGAELDQGSALTVEADSEFWANGAGRFGGGARVQDGSILTVTDSAFRANVSVEEGGGLWVEDSTVTFTDSSITESHTGEDGGGLYLNSGTVSLIDSALSDNLSEASGGGAAMFDGALALVGTTVSGNVASLYGGGLLGNSGLSLTEGTTVTDNEAVWGGGLAVQYGAPTLEGVEFRDNTASRLGGGIYFSGANTLLLSGGAVEDNTAGTSGGGIYLDSTAEVEDVDFGGNTAEDLYLASPGTSWDWGAAASFVCTETSCS